MGVRESLLNTITSVADSDFVRIVTSAGASSKATVRNLFKGFESNLSAKSSLTTSDYIRVVGSDNEAYKQSVNDVNKTIPLTLVIGLTTEELIDAAYITAHNETPDQTSYRRVMNHGMQHSILGGGRWYLEGYKDSSTYGWQKVTSYGNPTKVYTRSLNNGTWTTWEKDPTRAEIDSKVVSAATSTAGKITSLLLSRDSVGYYISVWSTDDPSTRRGYFRLDADTKTTSSITAEGGWTLGDFRTCAKVGSTVVFDYWCSYSGTPTTRQWITIGTIPSGYRPSYAYDMVAVDNSGVTSGVQIKVEASGAIKAYLLDNRSKGLRLHGVHFV